MAFSTPDPDGPSFELSEASPSMSVCSVIIRCYNEDRHIGRLLRGITQQTVGDVEIILVDSGSTDDTLAIASHYPVVVEHITPESFSFGRSLNLGCRAATSDFLVIVSAHCRPVYKDWLERLLAPFESQETALVYGKQRGNEDTQYAEHQIFAKWFPDEEVLDQDHPFCNNANAAVRKKVWEQLPYDESLTGLEDLDWAKRATALGHRITYAPQAEVLHLHDETPRQVYNRYRREAIAFKDIYPGERFGLWDFGRLFVGNVLADYRHAWRDGVFLKNLASVPRFRLMQFFGTYRGYAQHGVVSRQLKNTFYYPHRRKRKAPASVAEHRPQVDYQPVPSGESRADVG